MIAERGTGATKVSLRKPNWRSHMTSTPENTEEKMMAMPTMPGATNWM